MLFNHTQMQMQQVALIYERPSPEAGSSGFVVTHIDKEKDLIVVTNYLGTRSVFCSGVS
jgi:hypothetical protein